MSKRVRKPRSRIPYRLVRVPQEKVLARIETGARLRREQHDAAAGADGRSIYEQRGVIEV